MRQIKSAQHEEHSETPLSLQVFNKKFSRNVTMSISKHGRSKSPYPLEAGIGIISPTSKELSIIHNKNKGTSATSDRTRNKTLIGLSRKVLEIIKENQGITSTNVANELVRLAQGKKQCDFKNIQRRVYDVVNVLCALDFIHKANNGTITFKGYSKVDMMTYNTLTTDIRHKNQIILDKKKHALELVLQQMCINKLLERNIKSTKSAEENGAEKYSGTRHSTSHDQTKVSLPFVAIKLDGETEVRMNESNRKMLISTSKSCQLYDDNHIFSKLNMPNFPQSVISEILPPKLYALLSKDKFLTSQRGLLEESIDISSSALVDCSGVEGIHNNHQPTPSSFKFTLSVKEEVDEIGAISTPLQQTISQGIGRFRLPPVDEEGGKEECMFDSQSGKKFNRIRVYSPYSSFNDEDHGGIGAFGGSTITGYNNMGRNRVSVSPLGTRGDLIQLGCDYSSGVSPRKEIMSPLGHLYFDSEGQNQRDKAEISKHLNSLFDSDNIGFKMIE